METKYIWKDIPGWEGLYQIDDTGNVWSIQTKRMLRCFPSNSGYVTVRLNRDKIGKTYTVHRLVMLAFRGISDMQVNHIDGDKANNYLSNLEYVTPAENMAHARKTLGYSNSGASNPSAKLTEYQVREIRRMRTNGMTMQAIATHFGVVKITVQHIIHRRTWKHLD